LVDEVVDTTKTVVKTMIVNIVTANSEGTNVVIDLFLFIEYMTISLLTVATAKLQATMNFCIVYFLSGEI